VPEPRKRTSTQAIAIFSFSFTRYAFTHRFSATDSPDIIKFDLVDKKELAPLDELNDAVLAEDKHR